MKIYLLFLLATTVICEHNKGNLQTNVDAGIRSVHGPEGIVYLDGGGAYARKNIARSPYIRKDQAANGKSSSLRNYSYPKRKSNPTASVITPIAKPPMETYPTINAEAIDKSQRYAVGRFKNPALRNQDKSHGEESNNYESERLGGPNGVYADRTSNTNQETKKITHLLERIGRAGPKPAGNINISGNKVSSYSVSAAYKGNTNRSAPDMQPKANGIADVVQRFQFGNSESNARDDTKPPSSNSEDIDSINKDVTTTPPSTLDRIKSLFKRATKAPTTNFDLIDWTTSIPTAIQILTNTPMKIPPSIQDYPSDKANCNCNCGCCNCGCNCGCNPHNQNNEHQYNEDMEPNKDMEPNEDMETNIDMEPNLGMEPNIGMEHNGDIEHNEDMGQNENYGNYEPAESNPYEDMTGFQQDQTGPEFDPMAQNLGWGGMYGGGGDEGMSVLQHPQTGLLFHPMPHGLGWGRFFGGGGGLVPYVPGPPSANYHAGAYRPNIDTHSADEGRGMLGMGFSGFEPGGSGSMVKTRFGYGDGYGDGYGEGYDKGSVIDDSFGTGGYQNYLTQYGKGGKKVYTKHVSSIYHI
uniref:Uncharacterized protein n=1 Tax=Heliothis virescens TaxID=7102 RepID=A0A2A4KAZ1_HELVI